MFHGTIKFIKEHVVVVDGGERGEFYVSETDKEAFGFAVVLSVGTRVKFDVWNNERNIKMIQRAE